MSVRRLSGSRGTKSQSISVHLSKLCCLQISAGLPSPQRADWPQLQIGHNFRLATTSICIKGQCQGQTCKNPSLFTKHFIDHAGALSHRFGHSVLSIWVSVVLGCLLHVFFCPMRSGEFTTVDPLFPPIHSSDVALDSHLSTSILRVKLRRAKTDPVGERVEIFFWQDNHCLMSSKRNPSLPLSLP